MPKTIFTSLSPNVEKDDVALAIKTLVTPWKWKEGSATTALQERLKETLSAPHVRLRSSGRRALYHILQAARIKKGDEVILQAYTCVAVPEPILWVGATPIYADCEADTLGMDPKDFEKKITKKTKAVIIQHTFGYPAKLQSLLRIAKKHNLFVIEDCAHALGATYRNKPVGTFGDASFFSFGRDKVISSVFGGAIATSDTQLAKRLDRLEAHAVMPSLFWIKRQLFHPVLTNVVKKHYATYGIGKALLFTAKLLRLTSNAVEKEERHGKKPSFITYAYPNGLAILALHQFKKLDRFNAHREARAKEYTAGLKNLKGVTLPPERGGAIYLRYLVRTKQSTALHQSGKKEGILYGNWYETPIAPDSVAYEAIQYQSPCITAERIARESINLPTDISISKEDAARIIRHIKKHHAG